MNRQKKGSSTLLSPEEKGRRSRTIRRYKVLKGCIDCGYKESPYALQFDHVRGKKSFDIGSGYKGTWNAVKKEIKKCEIRCANCHAIVTAERRRKKLNERANKIPKDSMGKTL